MYTFDDGETEELLAAFRRIGNYLLREVCPKLRWEVAVTRAYVVGDDEFRMTLKLSNPRGLSEESLWKGCAATVWCDFVRSGRSAIGDSAYIHSFSDLCASGKVSESVAWVVQNWMVIQQEIANQLSTQNMFVSSLGTILPERPSEL